MSNVLSEVTIADRLARRADRLGRLLRNSAPPLLVKNERRLISDAVRDWRECVEAAGEDPEGESIHGVEPRPTGSG